MVSGNGMQMSEDPLIAIFKLGKKAHMEELLNKGHVFMNAIAYFSSLEEASPRSDPDEGTRYCQNAGRCHSADAE